MLIPAFSDTNPKDNRHPLPFIKKSGKTTNSARGARILIVEDELLVAEDIKEMLTSLDYKVVGICRSGEEAIRNFSKLNPDLILMDIRLDGAIDGIQTAIKIHTIQEVPVIFLTAYASNQFPHLADVRDQLYKFVTKPCESSELIGRINELLQQS
jgi:CheY-like chemotaxis protein